MGKVRKLGARLVAGVLVVAAGPRMAGAQAPGSEPLPRGAETLPPPATPGPPAAGSAPPSPAPPSPAPPSPAPPPSWSPPPSAPAVLPPPATPAPGYPPPPVYYVAPPPGYVAMQAVPAPGPGPAPRPRLVWPDDTAVRSSPFLDATISGISLEDRFSDPFVFGIGLGAYLAQVVRVVARLEVPSTTDEGDDYFYDIALSGYSNEPPGEVKLVYGGSVGIIATHGPAFVFSPGFTFLRTDVPEYGNMLGVALPFDWTTSRGVRFGVEFAFGRAFGGERTLVCSSGVQCELGARRTVEREDSRAFVLRFELGFGFNHPKPQQVTDPAPAPAR